MTQANGKQHHDACSESSFVFLGHSALPERAESNLATGNSPRHFCRSDTHRGMARKRGSRLAHFLQGWVSAPAEGRFPDRRMRDRSNDGGN